MSRRLFFVAVALAAGLVVSVLVAWAFAWLVDRTPSATPEANLVMGISAADQPRWEMTIRHRPGTTVITYLASARRPPPPPGPDATEAEIDDFLRSIGRNDRPLGSSPSDPVDVLDPPRFSRANTPPRNSDFDRITYIEDARGWPARCLVGFYDHRTNRGSRQAWLIGRTWRYDLGGPPGPGGLPRALPLRPIWTGLLINSVFYGVLIGALMLAAAALRRRRRARTGHCPACGYDLRATDHERCPECGRISSTRLPIATDSG
jgi:hypothetical protein